MLVVSSTVSIPLAEIEFTMIRAEGPGGQHVNKTSSAIQLRFNIGASSLPDAVKQRLLAMRDHRITAAGEVVIKAQDERSLLRNKEEALDRLRELVARALIVPKKRKKTRPTKSSIEKRLNTKKNRSQVKKLRRSIPDE
jgi:ribosome-associated protein